MRENYSNVSFQSAGHHFAALVVTLLVPVVRGRKISALKMVVV